MNTKDKVNWVYNVNNNSELTARYNLWAKEYDQDLKDEFGYTNPLYAVEVLVKYVSRDANILDAGVGTGWVGQLLDEQGYHNLEGMDMSEGMLSQARNKNIYTTLYQKTMGEPLSFGTNSFDAIISVGVFSPGHAPASSFDELIRIVKPGGYIIFTLRPDFYQSSDFKEKMAYLEISKIWELVEVGKQFKCLPKGEPNMYSQVWAYRKV